MSYELQQYSAIDLAALADVGRPDHQNSPGARFLLGVADSVRDQVDDLDATPGSTPEDVAGNFAFEIADSAVPVYYAEQIEVISDLQLWSARVDEMGECETLSDAMTSAIYDTAHNLVFALVRNVVEHEDQPF